MSYVVGDQPGSQTSAEEEARKKAEEERQARLKAAERQNKEVVSGIAAIMNRLSGQVRDGITVNSSSGSNSSRAIGYIASTTTPKIPTTNTTQTTTTGVSRTIYYGAGDLSGDTKVSGHPLSNRSEDVFSKWTPQFYEKDKKSTSLSNASKYGDELNTQIGSGKLKNGVNLIGYSAGGGETRTVADKLQDAGNGSSIKSMTILSGISGEQFAWNKTVYTALSDKTNITLEYSTYKLDRTTNKKTGEESWSYNKKYSNGNEYAAEVDCTTANTAAQHVKLITGDFEGEMRIEDKYNPKGKYVSATKKDDGETIHVEIHSGKDTTVKEFPKFEKVSTETEEYKSSNPKSGDPKGEKITTTYKNKDGTTYTTKEYTNESHGDMDRDGLVDYAGNN